MNIHNLRIVLFENMVDKFVAIAPLQSQKHIK